MIPEPAPDASHSEWLRYYVAIDACAEFGMTEMELRLLKAADRLDELELFYGTDLR